MPPSASDSPRPPLRREVRSAVRALLLTPDDALGGRTPLEILRREGWTEALARLVRIEQGDGFA